MVEQLRLINSALAQHVADASGMVRLPGRTDVPKRSQYRR